MLQEIPARRIRQSAVPRGFALSAARLDHGDVSAIEEPAGAARKQVAGIRAA
jgi:hypothetical protein